MSVCFVCFGDFSTLFLWLAYSDRFRQRKPRLIAKVYIPTSTNTVSGSEAPGHFREHSACSLHQDDQCPRVSEVVPLNLNYVTILYSYAVERE
ncbi:MAG: hypothetical protein NXY57DRAFT_983182 [Lentinula lateritia]|nr:MAG: hypothetical protein NXY57DRAFT_983182 [Lentinula lateritia]